MNEEKLEGEGLLPVVLDVNPVDSCFQLHEQNTSIVMVCQLNSVHISICSWSEASMAVSHLDASLVEFGLFTWKFESRKGVTKALPAHQQRFNFCVHLSSQISCELASP